MFIRNGIRSNLRAKGRTALFSCLILSLTLAMVLALGVRLYCGSALEQCEQFYRSIALVEYMGAEYPDENEPDGFARTAAAAIDDSAVEAIDGVRYWSRDDRCLSCVEGYTRHGSNMPYGKRGVLVVWDLTPVYKVEYVPVGGEGGTSFSSYKEIVTDEVDYYTGLLSRAVYSYDGKQDIFVNVLADSTDFQPERGKFYVIHGSFYEGWDDGPRNGIRSFAVHGFDKSDTPPWAVYQKGDELPEIFADAADRYRTINNYVETVTAPDLADLRVFHQGIFWVEQGRLPEPGETDACVLSGDTARDMGVAVGDTIRTAVFDSAADDRYGLTETDRWETLRVVGITNALDGRAGYMWRCGTYGGAALFGYTIGTASLENAKAADAVETMAALMPENIHVTLLDQGYADAVEPFTTMQNTASNVLLACGAGVIAVLLLFAFLFVGRQNGTVRILVSMGTPRTGIALWLLSGAVLIAGAAALAGGAIGAAALPLVFRGIQAAAERMRDTRLMFSEMLVGAIREPEIDVNVPLRPIALLSGCIVAAAVLFCVLFLRTAYRGGTLRRGMSRVRVPRGKTSTAGRGSLRFALLSIRRGGLRSLAVPVVAAMMTALVIVLCGIYQGWQNDLRRAIDSSVLEGQFTSTGGEVYSDLSIPASVVQNLRQLEDVDEIYVSYRGRYWLPGDMPEFGGGYSSQDRADAWLRSRSDIVTVNGLKGAKEFYFTDPVVTWLSGWDESFLADSSYYNDKQIDDPLPAVVSDRFTAERHLEAGSEFDCIIGDREWSKTIRLKIVGVYRQTGNRANIYLPLAAYFDPDVIAGKRTIRPPEGPRLSWTEEDYEHYALLSLDFSTCRFTVSSPQRMEDIRQALANAGFGWPGHVGTARTTVLLRDAALVKLTENLGRYVSLGRVMVGMIMLIVALLGFIISWLMVSGRKQEFAVMRGFGAEKRRVFLSFFLEQAALCLTGCAAGCLALVWVRSGGVLQWAALAAFLICYLAGCAVSVKLIGRVNLMELLAAKE